MFNHTLQSEDQPLQPSDLDQLSHSVADPGGVSALGGAPRTRVEGLVDEDVAVVAEEGQAVRALEHGLVQVVVEGAGAGVAGERGGHLLQICQRDLGDRRRGRDRFPDLRKIKNVLTSNLYEGW